MLALILERGGEVLLPLLAAFNTRYFYRVTGSGIIG
jgi:hypothetical protein